jgi:hypothetical protein
VNGSSCAVIASCVAISNRRLIAADDGAIAFRWKDYRVSGPDRWKTMQLQPHEFIRRFLIHVLPKGFHRIRHYGLFEEDGVVLEIVEIESSVFSNGAFR